MKNAVSKIAKILNIPVDRELYSIIEDKISTLPNEYHTDIINEILDNDYTYLKPMQIIGKAIQVIKRKYEDVLFNGISDEALELAKKGYYIKDSIENARINDKGLFKEIGGKWKYSFFVNKHTDKGLVTFEEARILEKIGGFKRLIGATSLREITLDIERELRYKVRKDNNLISPPKSMGNSNKSLAIASKALAKLDK